LISLGPNELICQRFQHRLAQLGVTWLAKVEMDSLELIERYVEAGYGLGLSVRMPEQKLPSSIRTIALPDFSPVKLGLLHRGQASPGDKVCRAFQEEVRKQAARFRTG
jgi:DNA-binding transcriptional LysR family regulator